MCQTSVNLTPICIKQRLYFVVSFPVVICLFKGNHENTKPMCEICSKFIVVTPWRPFSDFLVNLYNHSGVSFVDFEQVNVNWAVTKRLVVFKNCGKCVKDPANIYLFKVNNRNTRKTCEICSKLTLKTPERRQWHSGLFIVNFEHISRLFLALLLLILNR